MSRIFSTRPAVALLFMMMGALGTSENCGSNGKDTCAESPDVSEFLQNGVKVAASIERVAVEGDDCNKTKITDIKDTMKDVAHGIKDMIVEFRKLGAPPAPAKKDLQHLGVSGCNGQPCEACQGDCDSDSHCAGHLKCFQRSDLDPIPGCNVGGAADKEGHDYCYDPTLWGYQLENLGSSGCNGQPCDKCQGDCDSDSHCKGDLKCYQRNVFEPVPGCSSGGVGDAKEYDFCFDPKDVVGTQLENLGSSGCNGLPCDKCQGDCDTHSHCKGDLKCYQRDAYEVVPGCNAGGGGDKKGYDYCYDPADDA